MRMRPVHISFLQEARNALSYRHCSFHIINWPQAGRGLKYFMRLVAIGFGYSGEKTRIADCGKRNRLFRFAPDDVLVVTTIDQCVHFAGSSIMKQNSAFDTFAEENL